MIGMFFWDIVGYKIIDFYDGQAHIDYIRNLFSKYGWLVILIAGLNPFLTKYLHLEAECWGIIF